MSRRTRTLRTATGALAVSVAIVVAAAAVLIVATAVAATAGVLPHAATPPPSKPPQPPSDLNTVINNIRNWLFGLLVALATLFLTVGFIRYLLAGGDPGEVGKAKDTLKYAAIGYGGAVLAPLLVTVLNGFLRG